ncbi:MAG: hypothetical protein ACRDPT_09960 [Streptomycetales bacterium]
MPYTEDELSATSRALEARLDALDPDTVPVENTEDLAAVAYAAGAAAASESGLRAAVAAARANGRSWNQIARSLGVSRQAARQRFGAKVA